MELSLWNCLYGIVFMELLLWSFLELTIQNNEMEAACKTRHL